MTTPAPSRPNRVLLIGGTSEIGQAILTALMLRPDATVLLAGRDEAAMQAAAAGLPCQVQTLSYDALDQAAQQKLAVAATADGPLDLVISAAGVLTPQPDLDADPARAADLIEINFTSHVTVLLALAGQLRRQGQGTIVILSSVAAIRPRKANYVYGAAKAGLDAFGRGLQDALHGSGVRVLLVRPGFVTGRMTAGMTAAPLSSTPEQVGIATAAALARSDQLVWVPSSLRVLATALRLLPRPVWRRLRR